MRTSLSLCVLLLASACPDGPCPPPRAIVATWVERNVALGPDQPLDFGDLAPGEARTQTVLVRDTGGWTPTELGSDNRSFLANDVGGSWAITATAPEVFDGGALLGTASAWSFGGNPDRTCTIGGARFQLVARLLPPKCAAPELVPLGDVVVGETFVRTFEVSNQTDASVPFSIDVAPDSHDGELVLDGGAGTLAPLGSATVGVAFSPKAGGGCGRDLELHCASALQRIPAPGYGFTTPLEWTPLVLDFGPVDAGQRAELELAFVNRSQQAVTLTGLAASPGAVFSADAGTVLLPAAAPEPTTGALRSSSTPVPVAFTPAIRGQAQGTLQGATALPATPTVVVPLRGTGR